MVGQEHVTGPLSAALRNDRVNHAYLFSGPRGCGKTTSARILARCLNCEQGPTPEPCGKCDSCVALARGGPGHIDVIEIDAASHGGVDDARDLRERAFFAPVQAQYKVYIVDEAHMVSSQGFNALLKLVEEPPEHVKFIFATTEPDKVIGTIRSRTHHYPFRLVPPKVMIDYLGHICELEGIDVDATVLPLVVRAGGGSFRDSLSVLDQLIGSAEDGELSYTSAVGLLGYTPESLLDETVDALAAHDGPGVFGVVDKVIESGQDPRRFGEDLLHRLRDLVVMQAVPDAATRGLIEAPPELAEQLARQSRSLGSAELTRAAEVLNDGLTQMRGATAPRLLLELICARLQLPQVDDDQLGLASRVDRLERRLAGGAPVSPSTPAEQSAAPSTAEPSTARTAAADPAAPDDEPASGQPAPEQTASERPASGQPASEQPASESVSWQASAPAPPQTSEDQASTSAAAEEPTRPAGAPAVGSTGGSAQLTDMRRMWPEVLDAVQNRKRVTWVLLSQNAQVLDVADGVLTLGMATANMRTGFVKNGHDQVLHDVLAEVLRVDLRIDVVLDPSAGGNRGRRSSRPAQPARGPDAFDSPQRSGSDAPPSPPPAPPRARPDRGTASRPAPADDRPPPPDEPPPDDDDPPPDDPHSAGRGRARLAQYAGAAAVPAGNPDDSVDVNGDDVDNSGESQTDLLAREFGATVIEEYDADRDRG